MLYLLIKGVCEYGCALKVRILLYIDKVGMNGINRNYPG